jgi:hypothetical protein
VTRYLGHFKNFSWTELKVSGPSNSSAHSFSTLGCIPSGPRHLSGCSFLISSITCDISNLMLLNSSTAMSILLLGMFCRFSLAYMLPQKLLKTSAFLLSSVIFHFCFQFSIYTLATVVHGTVLDSFLYSIVAPIPIRKYGNVGDSSYFRGITFDSIYGKLFENIIPSRYGDSLLSSELTFWF